MGDQPFYAPDRKPDPPQQPTPGFEQWRLRNGDRALICEFRDRQRAGAGVDVQLLEGGEILVSVAVMSAEWPRYVAEKFKLDHLRTGWSEV